MPNYQLVFLEDGSTRLMRPAWEPVTPTSPGLTRLERWLTRLWTCTLWTGGVGCPVLRRWRVLRSRWGKLYIHHFLGHDWSQDRHDHSAAMISIGLYGSYEEETAEGTRRWRAPWIRWFPATWTHRLQLVTPTVWTLVWAFPKQQDSTYWFQGRRWHTNTYRARFGKARKTC